MWQREVLPRRARCPKPRWIVPSRPVHGRVLPQDDGHITMVPEAVMVGSEGMFCPGVIGQRRPLLARQHVVHHRAPALPALEVGAPGKW